MKHYATGSNYSPRKVHLTAPYTAMTLYDVIKFDGVAAKVSHTGTRYKPWNRDSCYLTHEELPSLNTQCTCTQYQASVVRLWMAQLCFSCMTVTMGDIPINILVSVCLHKCKQERSPICRDLMTRSLKQMVLDWGWWSMGKCSNLIGWIWANSQLPTTPSPTASHHLSTHTLEGIVSTMNHHGNTMATLWQHLATLGNTWQTITDFTAEQTHM